MRLDLVNGKIYSTVAIKLSIALYNYFLKIKKKINHSSVRGRTFVEIN